VTCLVKYCGVRPLVDGIAQIWREASQFVSSQCTWVPTDLKEVHRLGAVLKLGVADTRPGRSELYVAAFHDLKVAHRVAANMFRELCFASCDKMALTEPVLQR
jgi:hypothetical protein